MENCLSRKSLEKQAVGNGVRLGRLTLQSAILHPHSVIAPDARSLMAGDVVLFRKSNELSHVFIERYQAWFIHATSAHEKAASNSRWTHVGILDENLNIWEATSSDNIRQTPLRQVIESGDCLAFRRLKHGLSRSKVADRLRSALLSFSRSEYNLRNFLGNLVQPLFPQDDVIGRTLDELLRILGREENKRIREIEANTNKVICSVFVENVLSAALGRSVIPGALIALPIHFDLPPFFNVRPLSCNPELIELPSTGRGRLVSPTAGKT